MLYNVQEAREKLLSPSISTSATNIIQSPCLVEIKKLFNRGTYQLVLQDPLHDVLSDNTPQLIHYVILSKLITGTMN